MAKSRRATHRRRSTRRRSTRRSATRRARNMRGGFQGEAAAAAYKSPFVTNMVRY